MHRNSTGAWLPPRAPRSLVTAQGANATVWASELGCFHGLFCAHGSGSLIDPMPCLNKHFLTLQHLCPLFLAT